MQVSAHGTGATIPPVDEQVVAMKLVRARHLSHYILPHRRAYIHAPAPWPRLSCLSSKAAAPHGGDRTRIHRVNGQHAW